MRAELSQKLQQFLEEYIYLIDNNDFSELYSKFEILDYTRQLSIANLSEVLLACDINPIPYFKDGEIPSDFLAESTIKDFPQITSNITCVKSYAFYKLTNIQDTLDLSKTNIKQIRLAAFSHIENIRELILPESITDLRPSAFSSCINLEKVYIGKNIANIGMNAFSNCVSLKEITFNVTFNTFLNTTHTSRIAFKDIPLTCKFKFLDKTMLYEDMF